MILLLAALALVGLFLTAVGLPGTWLFLCVVSVIKLTDPSSALGWTPIFIGYALALVAEAIEWVAASRYARKYGGSRRAGWGALLGGVAGAIIGFPVPLLGPLIGAVVGTFLGALVAELSVSGVRGGAERVAWGAMIGRIVAVGAKVGLGVTIAVLILVTATR